MQRPKDTEILTLLKNSDINQPVKMLYKEYYNDIKDFICNNNGNKDDAADIFQETILVFTDMVKTGRYRVESSIKTFLYAVAKNLWKQELRSRGRRIEREKRYNYNSDEVIVETEAEVRYFNRDMQFAIENIYNEIGDICRNILNGFYYEDLSMKELLKKFDYENEQVLRNRKSLCLKKIKNILQQNNSLCGLFKNLLYYGK